MNILDESFLRNPFDFTIEWKGSTGDWVYWDKAAESKMPFGNDFKFIVLHESTCVRGFSEKHGKGIYSNEVTDSNEVLTVKSDKDVLVSGIYKDIKDKIKSEGGKYAKIAYCAIKEKDSITYAKLVFSGSSLGCYIDGKIKPSKAILVMAKNPEQQKKGSNKYFVPMVSELKLTEKQKADFETITLPQILEKAKEIKEYFAAKKDKFSGLDVTEDSKEEYRKPIVEITKSIPQDDFPSTEEVNDDNLPF
jgi:hypothetical protein